MPTYEYRCHKGHQFERFQRMSDPPVATCPTCGKPAERILSGGAGFLFKGEGFYITDYRSESYQKAARAEKSDAGASGESGGKSGSGSGESKSEAPSSASTQPAADSGKASVAASGPKSKKPSKGRSPGSAGEA